jgi:hypothetical protein
MKQLCFTLLVVAIATGLYAQTTGQITGTVRDNTGAIVPGAEVTVTNTAQGTPSRTTTNNAGDYLIAGLGEGTYNIEISAKGFKKRLVNGVVLRVAEKARADATLDVGEITTEVTVAGEGVAQVETQSAEISGTVTGRQITQMPLNNRNFTQLITLVPGVSNQTGQDEPGVGVYGSEAYSVNGGRTEYNNWEVDGGDMMDNGSNGTINVYPSVDAIGEVKVLTSNYGAQYGRNSSGTIESVIKSGTKQFHGDVYEFLRNDDFNARNFFQTTRPEYRKNDYGYTIGGPVFIPHLLPKNDKTFFFFSEEWRRNLVPGQTFNSQEPSVGERGGNFSDVCPGAGSGVNKTAFPNCPVNPATGSYFANNTVSIDPAAQIMMNAMIPTPNAGSGDQSFYNAAPATLELYREELVRIDHNFTDNWRVFAHYIHDSWSTVVPNALWGNGTSFPTVNTTFVGPGTSTVFHLANNASPTLLNEFTWSYTADHIFLNAIGPAATPPPANFPMGSLYNNGFGGLLPALSIQGNSSYGGGFSADSGYFPWNNANPTYTLRDQVTKIWGNHNMYFGFYAVLAEKNEENSPYLQGILNFSATDNAVSTGNAFADFLTGRIASYQQTNAKIKYYNRYKIVEPYFQDDWHISRKLTLNLGLRVSGFGTYREKYMRAYNWEPSAYTAANAPQIDVSGSITGQAGALVPGVGNPFDGQVQCGANGLPAGCLKGHIFNPAPRVGFAYDLLGDGKLAIRGGYGVFYEHTNGNEGNTESLEGSAPLVQGSTQYNITGYQNIGAGGLAFPLNTTYIPTSAVWPYVQQWNVGVQHEFWKNIIADIAYVGSKGTHLTLQSDYNQVLPTTASANPFTAGQPITQANCNSLSVNGTPVTGSALTNLNIACGASPTPYRPYTGLNNITQLVDMANSVYNAMQVSVRRTVGRLQTSVAYTWSHSIDDSSDRYDGGFVNSYNFASNRASSNFDQRQLLQISYNYDLPFFTQAGLMHKVLGGWQLNGITSFQTGTPFTVTNGVFGDNAGVGNGVGTGSYPGVSGNANAAPPIVNAAGIPGPLLFNPNAFVAPTGLTFGDSGRNFLNNPSRTNFDMGLFKRFALTESRAFEFRAEGFNVFNHTQWNGIYHNITCYGGADNSAGDASCLDNNFLHPSGAHNPRILQLGAKFIF